MKQCPKCNLTFGDASAFCEECGTKLVDVAAPRTDSGRTAAAFTETGRTVYGGERNPDATVYAGDPVRERSTQYAGYGGGQPQGSNSQDNGRVQSHVGQSHGQPRNAGNYGAPGNYGPRNYGGNPPRNGGQRPPAPRKPRKPIKISKKIWIALAELVLLIALIVVFNAVGNSKTNPVDTATAYFNAMVEGDYDTIASLTDLPAGPFLTEEAFQKCCEEWSIADGETVTKVSAKEYNESSYYGYSEYSDYVGPSGGMSDYTKTIVVEYMLSGDPNVYTYHIQLVAGEEKTMFFFNQWEVVQCTPFLAQNTNFAVPKGATLVVDGYVVDDAFLQNEADAYYDNYVLDLFVGTHTMNVLVDGLEPATEEIYVYYNDDYFSADYGELSDGTKNAIAAQGKTLLEQIYTGALEQASAETALAGFAGNAAAEMADAYGYLVEDLHYDTARTTDKITLEDISVYNCYTTDYEGAVFVYLELECKAVVDYSYRDGAVKKTNSYYDYVDFGMYYQYIDGVWTPVEYGYFYY